MDVPEHHVEGALKSLFVKGWIERTSREGGRVARWGHRARERLGTSDAEMAVLAELLLRGPQTPGALRGRASRMHPFGSVDALLETLGALAERGLVERMARRPGERGERWRHLLATPAELEAEAADAPAAPGEPTPAAAEPAPPPPAPAPPASESRLDALEAELADLREEVESLRRLVEEMRG
jgi:uncharacterized protein YceH (UPF0502 family)